jgi:hypothetical protein
MAGEGQQAGAHDKRAETRWQTYHNILLKLEDES